MGGEGGLQKRLRVTPCGNTNVMVHVLAELLCMETGWIVSDSFGALITAAGWGVRCGASLSLNSGVRRAAPAPEVARATSPDV